MLDNDFEVVAPGSVPAMIQPERTSSTNQTLWQPKDIGTDVKPFVDIFIREEENDWVLVRTKIGW